MLVDSVSHDYNRLGTLEQLCNMMNKKTWADLAQLRILNNGTIAAEFLFEVLQDLGIAELFLQPLHSCQALPSVPLLYAHMHILF